MITTERNNNPLIDRYLFDFKACTPKNGWAQIDTKQDASYFGTWANPSKRQVVSYCEGDITVLTGEDDADFVKMVKNTAEWNQERGHWIGIDPMGSEAIKTRFNDLGLGHLLHDEVTA